MLNLDKSMLMLDEAKDILAMALVECKNKTAASYIYNAITEIEDAEAELDAIAEANDD